MNGRVYDYNLGRFLSVDLFIQDPGNSQSMNPYTRHSTATLMLENGADVRVMQSMLGHASLLTTQIYTKVSIKHLKEVHEKTHPG